MLPLALTLLLACGDKEADSGTTDSGDTHDHTDHGGTDTGTMDTSRTQTSDGGTYTVTWAPSVDPVPLNENFDVDITATPDVMPEGGFTVTRADASMPAHGHGMNVEPEVTDNGDGTATAGPFNFMMEGHWVVEVDLTSGDGTETASFNVMCCE